MQAAVKKAKEFGADGIQVYTTRGPMSPENLSSRHRKEFLDFVTSNGLVISALCGDLGEGFSDRANNPRRIEKSKRIMDLAKDLNTKVVTTHIGVIRKTPTMNAGRFYKRLVSNWVNMPISLVPILPLKPARKPQRC
jgi:sugar phosphate isomerase/epimerase